jgi:diaminohydroxyphosphoribosylaminopyrimidine deaminase/5-amino-6-(5-phosphoribosylamino)uracil reductase
MAEALEMAARVPSRPWPNPPVGALVVRDGCIVGRGAHHGAGLPHAEVIALDQAGSLSRGATLYTTLEPCNHAGRTPPCAPRVAGSGIRRLVAAVADPNPHVAGGGFDAVQDAGIDIAIGVLAEAALELIWPFAATRAFERPYVLLKSAMSIDARFSTARLPDTPRGTPAYLTGIGSRRDVHRLRRWADVILIGEGTLAADRPALDGRLVAPDDACPSIDPVPAYVDSDLSFAADWPWSRFFVFTGRPAAEAGATDRIERAGGTIVACDVIRGRVSPDSVLETIFNGIGRTVMIECGPTLASAFLGRGLVDRWIRYTAPVVLGAGPTWPEAPASADETKLLPFSLTRVERCGNDVKDVFDRVSFGDMLHRLTEDCAARLRTKGAA